jgi:molybdopterin-containing oxidoreductase family iron-sulfur binding subunit
LAQSSDSPTLARLRKKFELTFPEAQWHIYQPLDRDHEFEGARLAFGRTVRPQYQLQKAKTIVCFDADILGMHPGHQRWCRDWAAGRNPNSPTCSRLWAFETGFAITGAAAHLRQTILPSKMLDFVNELAEGLTSLKKSPASEPVSPMNSLTVQIN